MHAGENCSGLQAAGSFVKVPNGYHFLWKPSTERKKKKKKNHPSFVYSHTHMLTYVPVKYQNPDDIPAQVFRLVLCQKYQRLSPPPPPHPPRNAIWRKERKKEKNHHHQFFLSHTQHYMSLHHLLLLLVLSGSVKLDNSQKNSNFFQNTQFQQNHPRVVVGTVDSFFCEFQNLLYSLNFLT